MDVDPYKCNFYFNKSNIFRRPRQLITHLQNLQKCFDHQRNIVHQFKAMSDLKSNLQGDAGEISVVLEHNRVCTP